MAVSNRIISLKLKSQKINVNLIQVYAPTMDSNKNAIQEFYKDLDVTKKKCKSVEMLLVMGDWNAKIGLVWSNPWLVVMVWEVGMKEIYWLTGVVKIAGCNKYLV